MSAVEPELVDLVGSGVMERRYVEDLAIYSLASDDEMRRLVDEFILACEDRHFRVKAVYHIIRGMR